MPQTPDAPDLYVFGHKATKDRAVLGIRDRLMAWGHSKDEALEHVGNTVSVGMILLLGLGWGGYQVGDVIGQPEQDTMAQVLKTRYTPAHYEHSTSVDENGVEHEDSTYVPDHYEAMVKIPEQSSPTVIDVSSRVYHDLQSSRANGAIYQATFREGRWSHQARMVELTDPLQRGERHNPAPSSPGRKPQW